jgi:LmbE family N-acetylglucosaminyl deacetylase
LFQTALSEERNEAEGNAIIDVLAKSLSSLAEGSMIRSYLRQIYRIVYPLLYSRSQFKLFLRASFGDIDERMLALASSTDYFSSFVRPVPIKAPFGESMLIVAPHQDDETIGCGGALALQVRAGRSASVLLLTDGADGCEEVGMTRQAMMEMRNEESRLAAAVLGLESPVFLGYSSLTERFAEAVEQVRREIVQRTADVVFIPWVFDANPDHRTANYILAEALKSIGRNVRVLQYEVWGLCVPNVILVIDEAIEAKVEMLNQFRFANSALDYTHSTQGLNMFHSRMLGAGQCRYAERFFESPRAEYVDLVLKVREAGR